MEVSGILVINKPEGVSSHTIVNKIRRIYGIKSVGHTGTLDPMATGVLPVLVGRSVKAAEYLQEHDKSYTAGVRIGVTTDSGDITGNILSEYNGPLPSFAEFKACAESFIGEQLQVPPMYSALKMGGVKLVDLARKGIEVERKPRSITVYSISAYEENGRFYIDVNCSKGTYIRTLCEDIGKKLGCGACMSSLRRNRVGEFDISASYTVEELANADESALVEALIPVDKMFESFPAITLPPFYAKLFKNGCEIYLRKLRAPGVDRNAEGVFYRIYDSDSFIALAESQKFENGIALKARKMFFQ